MPTSIVLEGPMKKLIGQILKFSVVGGSAFIIDYGILIIMTEVFRVDYLVSSGFSFTVSVVFNYIMSIKWVFNVEKTRNKKQEMLLFFLFSIIGLGINQFIMWIMVDKFGVFYMISKIGATIVVMIYNFITRKLFLE